MDVAGKLNTALKGRYEIDREIGAGGMATVYLARDLKHNRSVALKLLKPELGAVLGADRFLAEIQVTANLQHPNLLPLFDSGEADDLLFYVMPYVEGESLRARLNREKQLPVDDAVRIAVAIAGALDYAHQHGVVHRDLKPENILLQHGQPVLADFGIALAVANAGGARVTQTGISLGTPQYMSPEQATGDRAIDGRSDIYSLGAVLYEALTGDPPHTGSTAQAIIAKVVTDRPRSVRTLRTSVPKHVADAVDHALEKLPADRFAEARDFADALTGARVFVSQTATSGFATSDAAMPPRAVWVRRSQVVAPWLVAAAALVWGLTRGAREETAVPTAHFAMVVPPTAALGGAPHLAISPAGTHFAWVGQTPSGARIFVRALDDLQPRALAGTDGGYFPCFSPDGRWLAYFADRKLRKVSLAGGAPVTIATTEGINPAGCDWSPLDSIVIGDARGPLSQVSAAGSARQPLVPLDTTIGETSHRAPRFVGDGRTIAFVSWRRSNDDAHLAFRSPDGRVTVASQVGQRPAALADGRLVYAGLDGTLMVAPFDPRRVTLGPAVPVAMPEGVDLRTSSFLGWGVSLNGTLVLLRNQTSSRLVRVSRTGAVEPLGADSLSFRGPRVSPDGGRIAVEVNHGLGSESDLWIYSMAAQTLSRLTRTGHATDALWSRDGRRITFTDLSDTLQSSRGIYQQNADGSGRREFIVGEPGLQWPQAWAGDGTLVYETFSPGRPTQLKVFAPGTKAGRLILPAPTMQALAQLSPDGKWIAYASTETGRYEVFVSPFPAGESRVQVSAGGGHEPTWAPGGRELFYRDNKSMMAATLQFGPSVMVTGRRALFDDGYVKSNTRNYDPLPDGQHFLMLKPSDEPAQFIVITNWISELNARLGLTRQGGAR